MICVARISTRTHDLTFQSFCCQRPNDPFHNCSLPMHMLYPVWANLATTSYSPVNLIRMRVNREVLKFILRFMGLFIWAGLARFAGLALYILPGRDSHTFDITFRYCVHMKGGLQPCQQQVSQWRDLCIAGRAYMNAPSGPARLYLAGNRFTDLFFQPIGLQKSFKNVTRKTPFRFPHQDSNFFKHKKYMQVFQFSGVIENKFIS